MTKSRQMRQIPNKRPQSEPKLSVKASQWLKMLLKTGFLHKKTKSKRKKTKQKILDEKKKKKIQLQNQTKLIYMLLMNMFYCCVTFCIPKNKFFG